MGPDTKPPLDAAAAELQALLSKLAKNSRAEAYGRSIVSKGASIDKIQGEHAELLKKIKDRLANARRLHSYHVQVRKKEGDVQRVLKAEKTKFEASEQKFKRDIAKAERMFQAKLAEMKKANSELESQLAAQQQQPGGISNAMPTFVWSDSTSTASTRPSSSRTASPKSSSSMASPKSSSRMASPKSSSSMASTKSSSSMASPNSSPRPKYKPNLSPRRKSNKSPPKLSPSPKVSSRSPQQPSSPPKLTPSPKVSSRSPQQPSSPPKLSPSPKVSSRSPQPKSSPLAKAPKALPKMHPFVPESGFANYGGKIYWINSYTGRYYGVKSRKKKIKLHITTTGAVYHNKKYVRPLKNTIAKTVRKRLAAFGTASVSQKAWNKTTGAIGDLLGRKPDDSNELLNKYKNEFVAKTLGRARLAKISDELDGTAQEKKVYSKAWVPFDKAIEDVRVVLFEWTQKIEQISHISLYLKRLGLGGNPEYYPDVLRSLKAEEKKKRSSAKKLMQVATAAYKQAEERVLQYVKFQASRHLERTPITELTGRAKQAIQSLRPVLQREAQARAKLLQLKKRLGVPESAILVMSKDAPKKLLVKAAPRGDKQSMPPVLAPSKLPSKVSTKDLDALFQLSVADSSRMNKAASKWVDEFKSLKGALKMHDKALLEGSDSKEIKKIEKALNALDHSKKTFGVLRGGNEDMKTMMSLSNKIQTIIGRSAHLDEIRNRHPFGHPLGMRQHQQ